MANPLNNPNNKFNLWEFHQGDPVPKEGSSELKILRFLVKTGMYGWEQVNQLYKELEADTNHQLATAEQRISDLTNTAAGQQLMLADQQSKIDEMERQISLLTSQSRDQTNIIAGQQATIAEQQSKIVDYEQRRRRDRRSIQTATEKLNSIEAKEKSARLEVARLQEEISRVTDQTQRFMGLMERGAKIAEATVEQARGECQGRLELKNDKLTEQSRLIACLQAQVARLEQVNHEIRRGNLKLESPATVDDERLIFQGQPNSAYVGSDDYVPPPWKIDRPMPMEPGTAGSKRQADFGDQVDRFESFKLPRRN